MARGKGTIVVVGDKSGAWIDKRNSVVHSNTGQLVWDYSGDGFFTMNTPGVQGVVGFGGGRTHDLGDVKIAAESPKYANVYVYALAKDKTIANDRRLLVTTVARMVNDDVKFDEFSEVPVVRTAKHEIGPLLIEPVKATITLKGRKNARVYALDHDGRKQPDAMEMPVQATEDGITFTVDGTKSKTVYHVVQFE